MQASRNLRVLDNLNNYSTTTDTNMCVTLVCHSLQTCFAEEAKLYFGIKIKYAYRNNFPVLMGTILNGLLV